MAGGHSRQAVHLLRCLRELPFSPSTAAASRTSQSHCRLKLATHRRGLATPSNAASIKYGAGDARKRDVSGSEQKISGYQGSPIYPDSKAAERRHPHAPPLFQHFKRGSVTQNPSSERGSKQRVSSDAYILRNVSTDPELKSLYTSLGKAADNHDAVQATKLCQLIKERKEKMSDSPEKLTFEPEEKVVFLAVMRALAHHGLLEEIRAVNADMLSFGFEECIDSLNHMLQAAIVSADEDATGAILERIFSLLPSSSSITDRSEQLAKLLLKDHDNTASQANPSNRAGSILPTEKMRNWNAVTFAHVVDSACQNHNMEFALLLLSTCYRMGLTLPHEMLSRLVGPCLHGEEFRTAIELADLIEQGGLIYRHATEGDGSRQAAKASDLLRSEARSGQVARRFAPSIWMSILRTCAEGGYLPGVELAWSRAVTQGLLSPDEGVLLLVLALAAKEGSVQMARMCLKHIDPTFGAQGVESESPDQSQSASPRALRNLSTPSKRLELQEWHLTPLFEAHCSARDYQGAMRTLLGFHHRGIRITERTMSCISTSIYPDRSALQLARDALTASATDAMAGTHIAIVNAILRSAVWLGDFEQALDIYRAIPSYHTLANAEGGRPRHQPRHLTPNLETFNALLSGCIDAADYEMGVELLKDLNKLRLRPTVVTFERMIVLCLTQRNYDDAFGFIEEAKEKGIPPSRISYEALIRKCFEERDHRWEGVLADMRDQGYHPSPRLRRELDLDEEPMQFRSPRLRS